MKISQALLYSLLLQSLILSAAEPVTPPEEATQVLCADCHKLVKTELNNFFDDAAVEYFTQPLEHCYPQLLVFVKTGTQTWQLALVREKISENKLLLHLCENHTSSIHDMSSIRTLKKLWQYAWQPRIPRQAIHDSFRLFIERYRRTQANPFLQAQVIDRTHKIIVIGDLHGSSKSLRILLSRLSAQQILDDNGRLLPNYYLVFTGDYTDRGTHGDEVWQILIDLKLTNQGQVWLLRGNHETSFMAKNGEFFVKWLSLTPGLSQTEKETFLNLLFAALPHALLLGVRSTPRVIRNPTYRFLLFCHGGIDQYVSFHEAIRQSITRDQSTDQNKLVSYTFWHEVSEFSGLLWSDFFATKAHQNFPWTEISDRGVGLQKHNSAAAYQFVEDQSNHTSENPYIVDAIVRGHQHMPGGIARLATMLTDDSDWIALRHDTPEAIERGSVYTCTSSPEGLAPFGCCEDSYALIEWQEAEQQWQLTPHIERRVPKRFAQVAPYGPPAPHAHPRATDLSQRF